MDGVILATWRLDDLIYSGGIFAGVFRWFFEARGGRTRIGVGVGSRSAYCIVAVMLRL